MTKYIVIYSSYLETEGLDASYKIFNDIESAKQELKATYNIIKKDYDGSIDWNDFTETSYSIGGYNKYAYHQRHEAYISQFETD